MIDSELKSICKGVLDEGLDVLGLHLGLVSKIDEDSYLVVAVMPEHSVFQAGEAFDLRDTYCREVVEKRKTIAITELDNERGLCKHPLYSGLPLESYISSPIVVGGNVWGTLNFSSMKIRETDFSNDEIELIEDWAKLIAQHISANS